VTGMSELAVVLATYNEADNLGPLVEALEGLGEDLCLFVVDDNSQDGTQGVAKELTSTSNNLVIINRPGKLGLGSALRAGLAAALATDARYVLTMDADCSHDPAEVPLLLEVARRGRAGMVQGSRYVPGGGVRRWSIGRRLLSRTANLVYHWGAGAPHESTTNFRVFSRHAASVILARARGDGYEFMPEATLLVLAAGLKVQEVPITFTGRERGESKMGKKQVINGLTFCLTSVLQYRFRLGRFSRRHLTDTALVE
jgi:glycosyltransferase involved in cell wall biosynthesis